MAQANKLLLTIADKPMVVRVADAVISAGFDPVVVVTGYDAPAVGQALEDRPVQLILNPHWQAGLAGSVKAGVAALPKSIAGTLIALGDMPLLRPGTLQALREAFHAHHGERIVFPAFQGRQGNPVIFPRRLFPQLLALEGDRGAKALIHAPGERPVAVPLLVEEVMLDCDNQDDYDHLLSMFKES